MRVSVCPSAVVEAPVERVWKLLVSPESYDTWTDARLESAEPPGQAQAGQHLELRTGFLGRELGVTMDVLDLDAEHHRLHLLIHLPLGLVNDETLTVAPAGDGRALVRFG